MLANKQQTTISGKINIAEYLEGELVAEIKHELVDGQVYAMVGASGNHNYISENIYRKFGNHLEYINIPTLEEYVIIEQDFVDITVYQKRDDWRSTHYFLEETIHFKSIDLALSVEEIYHRVNNEDMIEFLTKKEELDHEGE